MGAMSPDRVRIDLGGNDLNVITSSLTKRLSTQPPGPYRDRVEGLLSRLYEAAQHAWLAEQNGRGPLTYVIEEPPTGDAGPVLARLAGTSFGSEAADAVDAARELAA